MSTLPLPTFSGRLNDDFHIWIAKLSSWLRIHDVPEEEDDKRLDMVILALEKGSCAERWLLQQPEEYRSTSRHCLGLLQAKYGSALRLQLARQAALNNLASRTFRDELHRGETVADLINDFEYLIGIARCEGEIERKDHFVRIFRNFPAASRMLQRTTTLDSAFHEALRWEKMLFKESSDSGSI